MLIAGVDEVGRGPLAGPVIAAAVILKTSVAGIKDSKALSEKKRQQLVPIIQENAICYAYGRAEVEEIDALNIHYATLLAMKRAIENLSIIPDQVLVDGIHKPDIGIPCKAIIQGDSTIEVIGAASILAKVLRDSEMDALDKLYPGYGFAQHKGYPTKMHREALAKLGASVAHRKHYGPVAAVLNRTAGFNSVVT